MDAPAPAQPLTPQGAPPKIAAGRRLWGATWLAALPHLWLGLSAALGKLYPAGAGPLSWLGAAALVVFLPFTLGLLVYAGRRAWPLWSASWYFYGAWMLVIALGALSASLWPEGWVVNLVLILGAFAGMGLGYLALFRRSRLHALLAALFLMPVASQFELESIPNALEGALSLLFGLLAALVAAAVVRSPDWGRGVRLALAANLLAGAALTFVCFTRAEIPNFYGDSFADALLAFAVYCAVAAGLFLGPPVFWSLIERVRGPMRRAA